MSEWSAWRLTRIVVVGQRFVHMSQHVETVRARIWQRNVFQMRLRRKSASLEVVLLGGRAMNAPASVFLPPIMCATCLRRGLQWTRLFSSRLPGLLLGNSRG